MNTQVILALGANIGERYGSFNKALRLIGERIGTVLAISRFYETAPLNPPELKTQPDFLNAALLCISKLDPEELLSNTQRIELELGRNRSNEIRWGPRCIDIDILFFGDKKIHSPTLTVPHAEIQKREFVMEPLNELAETVPALNSLALLNKILRRA